MRPLLILGAVEKPPLIDIDLHNVLVNRPHAIHRPRVAMQIVLHGYVFVGSRRNADNPRHTRLHAVHVVQRKAHARAGLVPARLLAGAPRKKANRVRAPLSKDRIDGTAESCPIGQQQHHRGNAPRHADHRDCRAPAIEHHRLPRLPEYVFQHKSTFRFLGR
jgi:hypothetical protein